MINLLKIKYSIIRQGLTIVFFLCIANIMIQLFCDLLKIAVKLKTTERLLNWLTGEFAQTATTFFNET